MKKINKKVLYITITVILFIILPIISIVVKKITEETPPTLIIDNFSEYFPDMGEEEKTYVFQELYKYVNANISADDKIPESGALIRENTVAPSEYYTSAIVDIESVKLSLLLEVNEYLPLEYLGVIFRCPDKEDYIYENMVCRIYNYEGDLHVVWGHSYLIDSLIQSHLSEAIKQTIEDFVLSDQEILSAPKSHDSITYYLSINEKSYTNYSMDPITYSLTASVDDGRNYTIYINANIEDDTCAVYIINNDTNKNAATIFPSIQNTSLESWVHSLPGSESVNINYGGL